MRQFVLSIIICFSFHCIAQDENSLRISAERMANEGMELMNQGRLNESYPLLLDSWAFYDKHKQSLPIDYGTICDALGQYYYQRGEYGKAEELYMAACDRLKTKYSDSLIYRVLLSDMGWLYFNLHNFDKANDYLFEAKFLYEKNLDLGRRYARFLSNYALLQSFNGNTLWAKMYVDLSKDIYLKLAEQEQNELPTLLGNTALVYAQLGFRDEALNTAGEARELFMRNGYSRSGLPQLLNNIGTIYFDQKDYKTAVSYFEESLKVDNSMVNVLGSGLNLAWGQYCLNDKKCLTTSTILSDSIISDVMSKFTYLSNDERDIYWIANNVRLSIVNVICANMNGSKNIGTIYNNSLFAKGLLLKTMNKIKKQISNSDDSESIRILAEISRLEKELYDGNLSSETITAKKDSINNFDKELTKRNATYGTFKEELSPDWNKIKKVLSKDEAAIEFVQIPIIEGDSIPEPFINRYYALVLTNNSSLPQLIPLGTEAELKDLISNKSHLKFDRYLRNLYSTGNPKLTFGEKLYSCLWSPIENELKGISTIYYSPIGLLNSVSFNAITHDSLCLGDRYNLRLLSSTGEIPQMKRNEASKIDNAIVYGGVMYDVPQEDMIAEARGYEESVRSRSLIENDGIRSGWNYLPGTAEEAQNIISTLDSVGVASLLYTGAKANEESFKSLSGKSPVLLHIATHGFFLSDPKQIAFNPFIRQKEQIGNTNLMLRSGLLLAGANRSWNGENEISRIEDGILTAEEISQLDLSSTSIVALSACETGLGEIISTEGVFGLQRAFKLAGVQTLIMSLWKVPDVATSKLMIDFYRKWMSGMEIHKAFREAQLNIKKEYPSPYYWAGFVMLD